MGRDVRKAVFWCHLALGVCAGAVIFAMSATGVLLAFEGPLVAWAEAAPPRPAVSGATRLTLAALTEKSGLGEPGSVTLKADPAQPVTLGFGRGKSVALDPYTGAVLPSGSRTRDAFHKIEDVHRWLGSRDLGKPVTGAANAAFLLLVLGGPVLWWPRGRKAAILAPDLGLTGKARDFNWHNAVGLWSAPALAVITLSGVLMSYQGATTFLYKAAGESSPVEIPVPAVRPAPGLDGAAVTAAALVPDWESIVVRLPPKGRGPLSVSVVQPSAYPPAPRSQLKLDAATGAILSWEPHSAAGRGRRLRALARFLHTGEALGVPGRAVAALASAGGLLLVWTGLALSWRRWRSWRLKSRSSKEVSS